MSVIGSPAVRPPAVGTSHTPDCDVPAALSSLPRWERIALLLAAALTAAVWLAYRHAALTSDESGYLLLGQHWAPGTSLYGDHWVDRPPLLIQLFSLAGALGPIGHTAAGVTAPAVKALGAVAAAASVLLAGLLGAQVASPFARRVVVVTAVGLLTSPLLGAPEVDGELLALPFVLLGVLLLVHGVRRRADPPTLLLLVGAGAAGTAAALVKQNVIDVAVLALVLLLTARGRVPHLATRSAAVVTGATGMLALAVTGAALRGTTPIGLWDAIVTFRLRADSVIGASASPATGDRAVHLLGAAVVSGLVPLLLLTSAHVMIPLLRGRRAEDPVPELGWPALAMTAWEVVAVIAGGSYWTHYLTGLVPGMVLLVALARPARRGRRAVVTVVTGVLAATVVGHAYLAVREPPGSDDAYVMTWLREHAVPRDGVVVAFGHPDIVLGSGLTSPYEHLWSLPVRVRDPQLSELRQALAGRDSPRWVVVSGASLDSWGLRPARAQEYLDEHYVEQVAFGDWHVWRRTGVDRR